ncbi:MAG: choice-of-anchor X domain-containing protein [Candidatus Diapherotrites archaeon]
MNSFPKICLILIVLISFVLLFNYAHAACNTNGVCDSGEDKCTCPADCGECKGSVPGSACEVYSCATGLCRPTITYFCCGNHICESGENYSNCASDCPPKEISVELISPVSSDSFMYGDQLTFKAKVKADGALTSKANVVARTALGDFTLYDDGNHSDSKANDAIYAFSFAVPASAAKGVYASILYAEMLGASTTKNFDLNISPVLEMDASADKNFYLLGDLIKISGTLKKRGAPIKTIMSLSLIAKNNLVLEDKSNSDENGFFSFSEHTSLNQPEGEWLIQASGKDYYGNEGLFQKTVYVSKEAITPSLDMNIISVSSFIASRGDEIKILVNVSREGEPVKGAEVKALFSNNQTERLEEKGSGQYLLSFVVPIDFELGQQSIEFLAHKDINYFTFAGSKAVQINVINAPIIIDKIEPTKTIFALGETINFKLRITYGGSKPLTGANLIVTANDKNIETSEREEGYYYFSVNADTNMVKNNRIEVQVKAEDQFGNSEEEKLYVQVSGEYGLDYFFRTNPLILYALVFGVIFAIAIAFIVRHRLTRLSSLEKRRDELNKLRLELQDKYFNKGALSTEEYYALLNQYTSEIREIEAAITAFKGKKEEGREAPETVEEITREEPLPPIFKVEKKKKERKGMPEKGEEEFEGLFTVKKKAKEKKE